MYVCAFNDTAVTVKEFKLLFLFMPDRRMQYNIISLWVIKKLTIKTSVVIVCSVLIENDNTRVSPKCAQKRPTPVHNSGLRKESLTKASL